MTSGMAHISRRNDGRVYSGWRRRSKNLLTAVIMTAPGTLLMAKMLVPETEQSLTAGRVEMPPMEKESNVLGAIARGTSDGLNLALNVGAMLITFIVASRSAQRHDGRHSQLAAHAWFPDSMHRTTRQSGAFHASWSRSFAGPFDIPSMSQLSVGPSWATLTEAQRQQVTESFGRYISAIYADRFDSYAGQKLQVTGEQPAAGGVIVRSQIVKANGEPVNVDYMMRRKGDSWLISDIYLDGAISEWRPAARNSPPSLRARASTA